MNCDNCQDLLSEFADNELSSREYSEISLHLDSCTECREMLEDLKTILDACRIDVPLADQAPDSEAMWHEISENIAAEASKRQTKTKKRNRRVWNLSLPQLAASFASIAILAIGFTFVIVKYSEAPPSISDIPEQPSSFSRFLTYVGLAESPRAQRDRRIQEFKVAIDYWERRIDAKRSQWDGHFKDSFDRNLKEIDRVVYEYSSALETNPNDELTHEMLEAALYEKEELLRAFAGL
jgi:hypothetical protein